MKLREVVGQKWDVIVVGAGLAGLYTALSLDAHLSVLVVTKKGISNCNSYLAQGGIAAVLSPQDTFKSHIEDTLEAGRYENNLRTVETIILKGPQVVGQLLDLGVPFDRNEDGSLLLAREGGHSHRRIARVGDHTGRHVMDTLAKQVACNESIEVLEQAEAVDLLTASGCAKGVTIEVDGHRHRLNARHIVLATGGLGQLHEHTTNEETIQGDGFKLASNAGLPLKHMDRIQYHPTAFYEENNKKQRFLISEAVRGEGAVIRDCHGHDIMAGVHHLGSLAPRDIVVQQMRWVMKRDNKAFCYLDVTHLDERRIKGHFPSIYTYCKEAGYNMATDMLPVVPCCHYLMGGIPIDEGGETRLRQLYACGEVAYTGLHGLNRLASNSLLECLVVGQAVANTINQREAMYEQ